MFRSSDRGETWARISNVTARTVTFDPQSQGKIYATTLANGVSRSLDGGDTWQTLNEGLGNLVTGRNGGVLIDPMNPQVLYYGANTMGVFKSRDGGEHWYAVNSGLTDLGVFAIALDPVNPSVLYAAGAHGVFKTVTGGEAQ